MSKIVLRYVLSKDFPFIFAFAKLQNFFFRACSYLRQNLQAVNTKALDSNLSSALVNTNNQKTTSLSKIGKKQEKYIYVTYGIVPVNSVYWNLRALSMYEKNIFIFIIAKGR